MSSHRASLPPRPTPVAVPPEPTPWAREICDAKHHHASAQRWRTSTRTDDSEDLAEAWRVLLIGGSLLTSV